MNEIKSRIGPDGKIVRNQDGSYVVQIKNKPYLLDIPGVECINPEAPAEKQIFSKTFKNKKIFLPNQTDLARETVLSGKDVLVIGMTGYSSLTDEQCKNWGIKPGAYENACMDVLGATIEELQKEYPGIRTKIVHGASDMGIDRAVIEVARQLNIDHLGHSCPEYLFYVNDDTDPVHVAKNKKTYSDEFVRSLNILLSVGGRLQALEHDIATAIRFDKHLILVNLLRSLSSNGNPPARDGMGKVVDATAAFEKAIAMMGGVDIQHPYEEVRNFTTKTTVNMARNILTPATSFGKWKRDT